MGHTGTKDGRLVYDGPLTDDKGPHQQPKAAASGITGYCAPATPAMPSQSVYRPRRSPPFIVLVDRPGPGPLFVFVISGMQRRRDVGS